MWPFKKKGKKMEDQITLTSDWVDFVDRVQKHEGLRLKPYRCTAGKLTIGYGRNLDDVGISKDEADELLNNDLEVAEKELFNAFPWVVGIDKKRYYVLVEMVFNMGIARFKQFKKMISACEKKDWETASEHALDSAWHKQVGKRAETLAKILKEG